MNMSSIGFHIYRRLPFSNLGAGFVLAVAVFFEGKVDIDVTCVESNVDAVVKETCEAGAEATSALVDGSVFSFVVTGAGVDAVGVLTMLSLDLFTLGNGGGTTFGNQGTLIGPTIRPKIIIRSSVSLDINPASASLPPLVCAWIARAPTACIPRASLSFFSDPRKSGKSNVVSGSIAIMGPR